MELDSRLEICEWLQDSWSALADRIGVLGCQDDVLQELILRYREPHRAYHNLDHILHCLKLLEQNRDLCPNPDAVALAIWFHDAVYDPKASDNEEQSAVFARESCLRMGLSTEIADKIANMVRWTTHRDVPKDADTRLLVDIDLSTLGAAQEEFENNTALIRSEYAHQSDSEFRKGRLKMFEAMIDRPRIFFTDRFHESHEDMARANILASLLDLDIVAL